MLRYYYHFFFIFYFPPISSATWETCINGVRKPVQVSLRMGVEYHSACYMYSVHNAQGPESLHAYYPVCM